MFRTPNSDPQVEFIADQLKRVRWISGYKFVPATGYLLEWLPEGSHRMMLLQIALRNRKGFEDADPGSPMIEDAAQDFWNACVQQLGLAGDVTPATLVQIIESWIPQPSSP